MAVEATEFGAGVGVLAGLGMLAIPGLGPVVAAGWLASTAVGAAVGGNPISVIVPCHRVLGADGSLTGYAYGLEVKEYLLEMEQD